MSYSMTMTAAGHWRDYLGVCKLKVVALIVFTAMVGMFLATPGMVPWSALVFGTLGIGMAAASAAAINHVVDQHADAVELMQSGGQDPGGQVAADGRAAHPADHHAVGVHGLHGHAERLLGGFHHLVGQEAEGLEVQAAHAPSTPHCAPLFPPGASTRL